MKLSARNQIAGVVSAIHLGAVNSTVKADIGDGKIITSSITMEAVEELGLSKGDEVWVVIKSSDVMIGK